MTMPGSATLRDARPIDLTREAGSKAARELVEEVADLLRPHLDRLRPLGPAGLATLRGNVGFVLGGLLKAAYKGRVAAAQRRPGGSLWSRSPMGHHAFWGILKAMKGAGLAEEKSGIKTWEPFSKGGFGGSPTCVWATSTLLDIAAKRDVTVRSVVADWPVSRSAEKLRLPLSPADLVVCRPLVKTDPAVTLTPAQQADKERMQERVAALNEAAAKADIRGCLSPAFVRRFRHNLQLGGRLYAVGENNVQSLSPDERRAVTIDGEPVTEVDVRASQLTVLLALSGVRCLPQGDLYGVGGLPRAAVKAWVVQSLGKGSPVRQWGDGTADAVRAVKARVVADAVAQAFPVFRGSLRSIVPDDLMATLPDDWRDWAVGQYLTFRESEAMIGAAGYVLAMTGRAVLPMHDALMVPKSIEKVAKRGIEGAFGVLLGLVPKVASG